MQRNREGKGEKDEREPSAKKGLAICHMVRFVRVINDL